MSNIIQLNREEGSHFYNRDGTPCFEQPKAKGKGTTKTTLAHAKKLNLLVSPTTALKQSAKPQLTNWLIGQACMAVLTAPRKDGEDLTAFVKRVLTENEEHKEIGSAAAELGTKIHAAIASILNNIPVEADEVVCKASQAAHKWLMEKHIKPLRVEETVIADGVCGTCDFVGRLPSGELVVVDWKSSNKPSDELPREAWFEHREQIGFYATGIGSLYDPDKIVCYVVYLSTTEAGAIKPCEVTDWRSAYKSFMALFDHWCYRNDYDPRNADKTIDQKLDEAGL